MRTLKRGLLISVGIALIFLAGIFVGRQTQLDYEKVQHQLEHPTLSISGTLPTKEGGWDIVRHDGNEGQSVASGPGCWARDLSPLIANAPNIQADEYVWIAPDIEDIWCGRSGAQVGFWEERGHICHAGPKERIAP